MPTSRPHKTRLLLVALALPLVLTACGGSTKAASTPSPTASPTPSVDLTAAALVEAKAACATLKTLQVAPATKVDYTSALITLKAVSRHAAAAAADDSQYQPMAVAAAKAVVTYQAIYKYVSPAWIPSASIKQLETALNPPGMDAFSAAALEAGTECTPVLAQ